MWRKEKADPAKGRHAVKVVGVIMTDHHAPDRLLGELADLRDQPVAQRG